MISTKAGIGLGVGIIFQKQDRIG